MLTKRALAPSFQKPPPEPEMAEEFPTIVVIMPLRLTRRIRWSCGMPAAGPEAQQCKAECQASCCLKC